MNWAIELSRKHQPSTGMANLYGVVVFSDAHAYIAKVLDDSRFWAALNEVSGSQWLVFATRAEAGQYVLPSPPPGTLAMLVPVWREPSANRELLEAVQLQSTEHLA